MKAVPPPWDRLMEANEVRVGGFWELAKTHAREYTIHTYRRAWRREELKKFRYRTPGWQAQQRWVRAVAAPLLVLPSANDDLCYQLLGDHVELKVDGTGKLSRRQASVIWDLLYRSRRPMVSDVIGYWIANASDLSELRVARLPRTYRMPTPVAAWLCRSRQRRWRAYWGEQLLSRWASNKA